MPWAPGHHDSGVDRRLPIGMSGLGSLAHYEQLGASLPGSSTPRSASWASDVLSNSSRGRGWKPKGNPPAPNHMQRKIAELEVIPVLLDCVRRCTSTESIDCAIVSEWALMAIEKSIKDYDENRRSVMECKGLETVLSCCQQHGYELRGTHVARAGVFAYKDALGCTLELVFGRPTIVCVAVIPLGVAGENDVCQEQQRLRIRVGLELRGSPGLTLRQAEDATGCGRDCHQD